MYVEMVKITGTLSEAENVSGTLSPVEEIQGIITAPTIVTPEAYAGEYHITPSSETQTLETRGYYMENDVVIDPIPNNYGLITWNGSILTVS